MKSISYKTFLYIGITILTIFYLGPFLFTVMTSLKPEAEVYSLSLPSQLIFDRYVDVITYPEYLPAMLNSIIVSVCTVPLILLLASPAAYAITRFRELKGRSLFFMLFLIMMLLPLPAVIGYLYLFTSSVGIYDTKLGVILVYAGIFTPLAVWILSTYFRGVPKELEEAAMIDGASMFKIFTSVILPVSLPGLAVTTIISFISIWSEFIVAFTITLSLESRTVTVGTFVFTGTLYELNWPEVAAASVIATIPVAIVAFMMQRYIVKGLISGIIRA
ncbi:MAG: carbohydrate ABC transporter permease [Nitrososphaerota archaeon]|nr:carbohydrate ABC transporter permease [Nitrososphaerota archaeon]